MKYILLFTLGILTGLSFQHLPRMELFHDWPETAKDWEPRMSGNWSDEERDIVSRYFNGGRG